MGAMEKRDEWCIEKNLDKFDEKQPVVANIKPKSLLLIGAHCNRSCHFQIAKLSTSANILN